MNRRWNWNLNYFNTLSDEVAYWSGFLMADGCITSASKRSRILALVVSEKDREHLNKFCDAVGVSREAVFKNKDNSVGIHLSGMYFDKDLVRWGIVPRKTYNFVEPDVPINLLPHYLRGWIDGDGHVYVKGRGARITLAGNLLSLEWVQYAYIRLGYTGNSTIRERTDKYGVLYVGGANQVESLCGLLLTNNNLRLDRKWNDASYYSPERSGEFRNCIVCGKELFVPLFRVNDDRYGKYCSQQCRGLADRKPIIDGKRQCARCKEWTLVEEFSANKSYCKLCWREISRESKRKQYRLKQ